MFTHKSYEEVKKYKDEIENDLLKDPNVTSVGTVAQINAMGEKTGRYVIQVGVIADKEYPLAALQSSDTNEENPVKFHILKTGKIGIPASNKTQTFCPDGVPIEGKESDFADAAVAEVNYGDGWFKHASHLVHDIGAIAGVEEPEVGMSVMKSGRTTNITDGEVSATDVIIKINQGGLGKVIYREQIETTGMSRGGDSGSVLINGKSGKAVGLIFAGGSNRSYANKISKVLSLLSEERIYGHEGKKQYTFNATPKLSIISSGNNSASFFNRSSLRPLTTFKAPRKVAIVGAIGLMAATTVVAAISAKTSDKQHDDTLLRIG